MGYRRSLIRHWSRRDWLTIAIIAVSTAFLVGTALLLLTAGAQVAATTGAVSTSTTATYHSSIADAENASADDTLIFPLAVVDDESGTEYTVLGVPPEAPDELPDASTDEVSATIPPPGESDVVSGPVSDNQTVQFVGQDGEITATTTPHQEDTIFPSWWYTTSSSTVETLGPTGAIAIDSGPTANEGSPLLSFDRSDTSVPSVPIVSAHAFLLTGMNEILQLLLVATGAGAVVILVVLFSVTRISVWERLEMLAIVRSTGGTPRDILLLFGLRSTLLAVIGVCGGFLLGISIPPFVVTAAEFAGMAVTLEPRLTWPIVRILIPMLATLVAVGALAGLLAARPAINTSPTALQGLAVQRQTSPIVTRIMTWYPSSFSPALLDKRTLIPTGATLTVFILLVLLVGGISGAVAPLDTTEDGTITSADASHPIDSRLDVETADAFRAHGIDASPELVINQVHNGQSYFVQGANYSDFASITDAELIDGHEPTAPDEAVIGSSLAETQNVSVGDTRTLGGGDRPGISRVTIVGIYETDSMADDQLVVPLETGHQLSLEEGTVHVIRTSGGADALFDTATDSETEAETEIVQDISAPETAVSGDSVPITVYVRNEETTSVTQTLAIETGQQTIEREVTLEPDEETQLEIEHTFESSGSQTIAVHGHEQEIIVLESDTPVFPETLPERAPPGATLLVPVTTPTEEPRSDVTVSIDGTEATTNDDGIARIELPETDGTYELTTAQADHDDVSHEIQISEGQQRLFGATAEITPQTGTPSTTPEFSVTVVNHWPDELTQELRVATPIDEQTQSTTLASGESVTRDQTLSETETDQQIPPGEYPIDVTADGQLITTATYEVLDGDFDLETLPGEVQYQSGAAMGQLIEQMIGNIRILFGTMVLLAGLMTVGSTTAAFAQAVHARRKAISIHRSTGARPSQLLGVIVLDACKLAIPAALLATIGAFGSLVLLDALGLMSVFGIRLTGELSPILVLATLLGAIGIAVCSAVFAALPILSSSPTTVWNSR